MLWPHSWSLSAMCPPCARFGRAAKPCPTFCPPWPHVRHEPAMCPPCVRFGRASKPCPACVPPGVCLGRASKRCPSCVRHVSAFAAPPTLSGMCPPYVRFGFPSISRRVSVRPCVRLALYLPCVGFGRASKHCVSHVALCVRHVSALCLFFVLSLSARCSLFIRPLSVFGRVYGLALAGPLSALCPLFGFCAFVCSVSRSWWLRLVRLVTFSRQCSCLP